jgi:hypothetical protein
MVDYKAHVGFIDTHSNAMVATITSHLFHQKFILVGDTGG